MDGGETAAGELELARETSGRELEAAGVFGFGGVGNRGQMFGVEVVGDDGGAGFESRQGGNAEGRADIEHRTVRKTAKGHEELADFIELIRGPACLIAGGNAAMPGWLVHATFNGGMDP